jgi:fatty-acyl-CoA synthase
MMRTPLSLNSLLDRAVRMFRTSEIVSRLPDKSMRRHTYALREHFAGYVLPQ